MLSRFSHVRLCATPQTAAPWIPRPWDSPGKNTGVGCHCLLQCMKVKSESEVAQSCPTHSDPMDCSPPGSSVHGTSQERVLEWGAIVPGGLDGKEFACNVGDMDSIPGPRRSSGGGNGNLLQYTCLENPMDRRAWLAKVHGVSTSWTQLSN